MALGCAASHEGPAQDTQGRYLRSEALRAVARGHEDLALLIAVEAERRHVDAGDALDCVLDSVRPWERVLHGLRDQPSLGEFSPDGRLLVAWDRGGRAIVWNTTDGRVAGQVELPPGRSCAEAGFSHDSHQVWLRVAGSRWSAIELRDVTPGLPLRRAFQLVGGKLQVGSAASEEPSSLHHFAFREGADGRHGTACASDGAAWFWNVEDGEGWSVPMPGGALCATVAFDERGNVLAASERGAAVVLRHGDGSELRTVLTRLGRSAGSFSADGRLLLTFHGPMEPSDDGDGGLFSVVALREVDTGRLLMRKVIECCDPALTVASGALGRGAEGLLTLNVDGRVHRWDWTEADADHPTAALIFSERHAGMAQLAATEVNDLFAIARTDGRVLLLKGHGLPPAAECGPWWTPSPKRPVNPRALKRACAVANRKMTDAEWDALFPGEPRADTCPEP